MKLVKALCTVLCFVLLGAPIIAKAPVFAYLTPGAPIYFDVKVDAISPLTDSNASAYGLETPGGSSSPVGQYFNVTIWLHGATLANWSAGIQGVEVHLNITNFAFSAGDRVCEPVAFGSTLGVVGGVLNQNSTNPISYGINPGYYDSNGKPCSGPLAVEYAVAGASQVFWNNTLGLVSWIEFEIMGAPSTSLSQPAFYAPLALSGVDLETLVLEPFPYPHWLQEPVPFDIKSQGFYSTLKIDPTSYVLENALTAITPITTSIGWPYPFPENASVANNNPSISSSFDIFEYLNATVAGVVHIPIMSASSTRNVTVTGDSSLFVNATGGPGYANYYLNMTVPPVLGEQNKLNNGPSRAPGYLMITIPGDVDASKAVDLGDLVNLANAYGSTPIKASWNPNCDIDFSLKVDLGDLVILANNYKLKWTYIGYP